MSRPSIETEIVEVAEILERPGVRVRLEGAILVIEGDGTDDLAVVAGVETLRGRERAVRLALALPVAVRAKLAEKRNAERLARQGEEGAKKKRKGGTA